MHANDFSRWRAKIDQIEAVAATDIEYTATVKAEDSLRDARDTELRAIIEDFTSSVDFAAFRHSVDVWSRQPGPYIAFSGFGQMWLNQVRQ